MPPNPKPHQNPYNPIDTIHSIPQKPTFDIRRPAKLSPRAHFQRNKGPMMNRRNPSLLSSPFVSGRVSRCNIDSAMHLERLRNNGTSSVCNLSSSPLSVHNETSIIAPSFRSVSCRGCELIFQNEKCPDGTAERTGNSMVSISRSGNVLWTRFRWVFDCFEWHGSEKCSFRLVKLINL